MGEISATAPSYALLLLLSCAQAAFAQDSTLTGRGGSLTPARSTSVKLQGLSVEQTFLPDEEAFRVSARFELHNTSKREQRLSLGLFEPRCESGDDEDASCDDPNTFRFEKLETLVRGSPVQARKGRTPASHEWAKALAGVWTFEVKLSAAETVQVEHRYQVSGRPAPGGGMSAAFVTRTGALWAEPIDKASFSFLIPVRSCLVVEPEQLGRRNRRVVLRDGEPWLQLSYGAQRWTPKADVSLYFETCRPPRDTELAGCSLIDSLARFAYPEGAVDDPTPIERPEMKALLNKLDDAELQRCGAAVFDAYASYFDPAELAVLAKRPSAARHYTAPLLTPEDWKWLGLVDEVQTERSRARAQKKPAAKSKAGCSPAAPAADGGMGALLCLLALAYVQITRASRASSSRG
jgi:hypothetical protein